MLIMTVYESCIISMAYSVVMVSLILYMTVYHDYLSYEKDYLEGTEPATATRPPSRKPWTPSPTSSTTPSILSFSVPGLIREAAVRTSAPPALRPGSGTSARLIL